MFCWAAHRERAGMPESRDEGVSRFAENGSHLEAADFSDEPGAVL